MSNSKRLIVLTSGSYPYGGAATNRHLSYLKGLVELGVEVQMIILQPDKNQSSKSNKNRGVFNGINFQYVIPVTNIAKNIVQKSINKITSIKSSIGIVNKMLNNNQVDTRLLILMTNPFEIIPFLKLAKKRSIKIFHERTEYPFIGVDSFINKRKLNLYLKIVNKFDGLFVITEALKDYFSPYVAQEKLIHIPMTVEPSRFDCSKYNKKDNKYGRYIAYCGSMYTDKDGVPILIRAFDLFADKYPDVKLMLIGDNSNSKLFQPISDEIKRAKHKDLIVLTGKVDRDEMPEILCNAEALALARPDNIQARGGFPTKLGEYLATGNPVAVTAVGEIQNYLINGRNAFIAKPDSVFDFLDILDRIFFNSLQSKIIGVEGKKIVFKYFNYKDQAIKIKKSLLCN
jgi:glycosyltransferase involved in cell wall biosynthesis